MSENCNVLTNNYDLHPDRLINSFMHRKFSGESPQSIVQWVTITEADLFSTMNQSPKLKLKTASQDPEEGSQILFSILLNPSKHQYPFSILGKVFC